MVYHIVLLHLLVLSSSLVRPLEAAEKEDTDDSAFELGGLRMSEEAE